MSMEWYRVYHNMPYDPKLQVIAKRTDQPMAFVVAVWVCLLDAASSHSTRGSTQIDPEEISVTQDIPLEAVTAILEVMQKKGLVNDEGHIVNWHKRQHTTSTGASSEISKQSETG